jgi:hypothetical protein
VAFVGDDAVVGTAGGELYRFGAKARQLTQVVQAHGAADPVLSMWAVAEGRQLVTGGKDGLVITWDANLKAVGAPLDMTDVAATDKKTDSVMSMDAAVVSVHRAGKFVLVGTRGGQVVELEVGGAVSAKEALKARILVNSHSTGELWGLDTHPSKGEFVTAGEGACRTLVINGSWLWSE